MSENTILRLSLADGGQISVIRLGDGRLSIATATFHLMTAVAFTAAEEATFLAALAAAAPGHPEPPLPDAQLANGGACT